MQEPDTPDHPIRRSPVAAAWEVVGLVAFVALAGALAVAIIQGRVTESVVLALLIVFRALLALRR